MLSFSLCVLGELIHSRQHHCFPRCSSSSALLQMLEKLGSNHSFLGMDRKPHSFPLSLCCVIQLWNDRIMVHCAHFQLPWVLAHILGNFHYSLRNPHNVCKICYFLWEYNIWTLFYLSKRPSLTTLNLSVFSGFSYSRETHWHCNILYQISVLTKLSKRKTTGSQMLISVKCLKNCWQFIKLYYTSFLLVT